MASSMATRAGSRSSRLTSMRMAWNVRLAGWPPRAAGGGRDGVAHDGGELAGGLDRPVGHDGARRCGWRSARRRARCSTRTSSTSGYPFTTSAADHCSVGVHPHVERTVVAVGEPALGPVELAARTTPRSNRTPEHWLGLEIGHDGVEVVEPGVAQGDPVTEGSEHLGRRRQCRRVPVDPEELEVGPGLEQQPGVAAAAERGVHQHAGWDGPEDLDDPVGHHRHVVELGHWHRDSTRLRYRTPGGSVISLICSPPAGGCRRDVSPTSETEAGGVGAVHLADRETADERRLEYLVRPFLASFPSWFVVLGSALARSGCLRR